MNFAAEIARATIVGSTAAENLTLAAGNLSQIIYEGGSGYATVTAGGANDILSGGSGLDVLRGGAGNDRINGYLSYSTGDGAADQLFGEEGNDYLYVGDGDSADGGNGNDVVTVSGSTGPASSPVASVPTRCALAAKAPLHLARSVVSTGSKPLSTVTELGLPRLS